MRRLFPLFVLCSMLAIASGCSTAKDDLPPPTATISTPTTSNRIRVADVTNATKELFDVDVIGMLWTGFNDSLNKRGLLYMGGPGAGAPYKLEATIVKYQKGSVWMRPVLPHWGKTLLVIRCDLKDPDNVVIATVESSRTVSLGNGTFSMDAWRRVFTEVAEDVVSRIVGKV